MEKFKVTFTEVKKYNPATRTIQVQTSGNAINAFLLTQQEYGKKKIIIKSIIGEDGIDFLQPAPPVEEALNNSETITMTNEDGVEVTISPPAYDVLDGKSVNTSGYAQVIESDVDFLPPTIYGL